MDEMTQLIVEARGLVEQLTRLSDEIERNPTGFLFGGNQRGGYQPR